MAAEKFHLAWFLNQGFGPGTWRGPWRGSMGRSWLTGDHYITFARQLEAAGFDYLLIEDSSYVSSMFGGSRDKYLQSGYSTPKLESTSLAGLLAHHTDHLGLVATLSTTEWNPYLLARHTLSMDHVTGGRLGWNIVTGGSPIGAKNFGSRPSLPHAERYRRAHEFTDLVKRLWDSWDADALVVDERNGVLVDPSKVHEINFSGEYFSSRGPLNVPRSPQGRPVIAQAGASPDGRRFGGTHADTIVASARGSVIAYKEYRDAVRTEAVTAGRNPDDVKVLFIATPYLGETEEEAQGFYERRCAQRKADPSVWVAQLSTIIGADLSTMDFDGPLGALASSIDSSFVKSVLDQVFRGNESRTLRELAVKDIEDEAIVGTPDSVAAQMCAMMTDIGGDGFLIQLNQSHVFDARTIAAVTDGLVPSLQARGAVRTHYDFPTFRENLTAF